MSEADTLRCIEEVLRRLEEMYRMSMTLFREEVVEGVPALEWCLKQDEYNDIDDLILGVVISLGRLEQMLRHIRKEYRDRLGGASSSRMH